MLVYKTEHERQHAFFHLVARMCQAIYAYEAEKDSKVTEWAPNLATWWERCFLEEKVSPADVKAADKVRNIPSQDFGIRFLGETRARGLAIVVPPYYGEVCVWIDGGFKGDVPQYHGRYGLHTKWIDQFEGSWWECPHGPYNALRTEEELDQSWSNQEFRKEPLPPPSTETVPGPRSSFFRGSELAQAHYELAIAEVERKQAKADGLAAAIQRNAWASVAFQEIMHREMRLAEAQGHEVDTTRATCGNGRGKAQAREIAPASDSICSRDSSLGDAVGRSMKAHERAGVGCEVKLECDEADDDQEEYTGMSETGLGDSSEE